jgi:hypothetical protein
LPLSRELKFLHTLAIVLVADNFIQQDFISSHMLVLVLTSQQSSLLQKIIKVHRV